MKTENALHTFVICAYGESPYLRSCILSLRRQSIKSRILVVTSTPNTMIARLAEKFDLEVRVNHGQAGLAGDWNFALEQADTPLVTLAHQDDVYAKEYTRRIIDAYKHSQDPVILFTDYRELRQRESEQGWQTTESALLKVKRLMLLPLRFHALQQSRWVRRRILSFGNAICCPSVTFVKQHIPQPLFADNMKSNIDWQAWERLSREKGAFVYLPVPLMAHRIHEESTTAELVHDHARKEEDLYMFRKFWPGHMPELIWKFYGRNERYQ